ncbi:hypothetical protein EK21DRAFT_101907 [Setomelanomma holmii]|uniref:DUF6546 domain-containing protein n=1 Tax=Setomelanomma holmii TaxID=210430 RepID=A0A9P4H503_9PLEO|nr:hypothetical protein EK21DRAFT_101907 [Setomelanomma holmii]
MDALPQELINRIVWFTERYPGQEKWYPAIGQSSALSKGVPSRFPHLAGLNRLWNEAVETITFRHLSIKTDDLDPLQAIVTGTRRRHVTRISFTSLLPEYSDEACAREESRDEQLVNDEAFTQGISELFISALRIDLLTATSPTDQRIYAGELGNRELMFDIAIGKRADILSDRWEKSRLHLLKQDKLPALANVQHLNIIGIGSRRFDPRVASDLAMSLPELRTIEWEFQDDEDQSDHDSSDDGSLNAGSDSEPEPDHEPPASPKARSETRMAFANKLSKTQLNSLHSSRITFYNESPTDQRYSRPSIVPEGFTYDPFSASLRIFSQRLTSLTLSAHLDSTIFWPSPDEHDATTPSWPHLKSLDITSDMLTPDFRIHPDPETFNPFLAAFAKAVARMPVLEYFMLTSELYHAPGKQAEWG